MRLILNISGFQSLDLIPNYQSSEFKNNNNRPMTGHSLRWLFLTLILEKRAD